MIRIRKLTAAVEENNKQKTINAEMSEKKHSDEKQENDKNEPEKQEQKLNRDNV